MLFLNFVSHSSDLFVARNVSLWIRVTENSIVRPFEEIGDKPTLPDLLIEAHVNQLLGHEGFMKTV